jgi:hypothetical protein
MSEGGAPFWVSRPAIGSASKLRERHQTRIPDAHNDGTIAEIDGTLLSPPTEAGPRNSGMIRFLL